jgi:hypothetical protein
MNHILHGIVRGKIIELSHAIDLADGQEVELAIREAKSIKPWGEGIKQSAGGWADYPEMDAIMERIRKER